MGMGWGLIHAFLLGIDSVPEHIMSCFTLSNIIFWLSLSFHVVCDTLGCTGKEVCRFRETYGCGCLEGQKPNPETFGRCYNVFCCRCTALQIT